MIPVAVAVAVAMTMADCLTGLNLKAQEIQTSTETYQ